MVTPGDITQALDTRWFDSLAGAGSWFAIILGSLALLYAFYLFWSMLEHKIKLTVFPIYGSDPTVLEKIESLEDARQNGLVIGHPKQMRGKDIKTKGIRRFSLIKGALGVIKPNKLQPVPSEFRYPDGIWLISPAKDTYIPIPRPNLLNTMNIKIPDADLDLWQQNADEQVRRRTQDEGMLIRQLWMTAIIIIGAFVLAGVIIWLSMSFAGQSIDSALGKLGDFQGFLEGITEGDAPG